MSVIHANTQDMGVCVKNEVSGIKFLIFKRNHIHLLGRCHRKQSLCTTIKRLVASHALVMATLRITLVL